MNLLIIIAGGFIAAFIGFAIGRLGDKYGGNISGPHHWIYGMILAIIGIFFSARLAGNTTNRFRRRAFYQRPE